MRDKPKAKISGTWIIAAMLLAAFAFMGGLYWTAYRTKPPEYRRALPGLPDKPLNILSWDLDGGADRAKIIDSLRPFHPDIILLQRIDPHEALEIARALDMRRGQDLQLYLPSPGEARPAIMARWPLYQGREMSKPRGLGYGICAEPVINGKKFLVGSIELPKDGQQEAQAMIHEWKKEGQLPAIVAGDFAGPSIGGDWKIALAAGPDRAMASPGIQVDAAEHSIPGVQRPLIQLTITPRAASPP